jgi:hypothetical protein
MQSKRRAALHWTDEKDAFALMHSPSSTIIADVRGALAHAVGGDRLSVCVTRQLI